MLSLHLADIFTHSTDAASLPSDIHFPYDKHTLPKAFFVRLIDVTINTCTHVQCSSTDDTACNENKICQLRTDSAA